MDTTRGAVNLEGVGGLEVHILVATDFLCCVGTFGRPVAKMPWAYLFSKNKSVPRKKSYIQYISNTSFCNISILNIIPYDWYSLSGR